MGSLSSIELGAHQSQLREETAHQNMMGHLISSLASHPASPEPVGWAGLPPGGKDMLFLKAQPLCKDDRIWFFSFFLQAQAKIPEFFFPAQRAQKQSRIVHRVLLKLAGWIGLWSPPLPGIPGIHPWPQTALPVYRQMSWGIWWQVGRRSFYYGKESF